MTTATEINGVSVDWLPKPTLTAEMASDIFSFFDLGDPGNIEPIQGGTVHDTYFVERPAAPGGPDVQVVRMLGYFSERILANEIHLQGVLHDADISAIRMTANKEGEVVFKDGRSMATISPKLPGRHPEPATERDCWLAGRALARLHAATDSLPYQSRVTLLGKDRVYGSVGQMPDGPQRQQLEGLLKVSSRLFEEPLPQGVLHGDFHEDNMLINNDEVAILDLESASQGAFVLDIGRSLAALCRTDAKEALAPGKIASLVEGYQETRKLTTAEERLLQPAIAYSYVATASLAFVRGQTAIGNQYVCYGLQVGGMI